MTSPDLKLSDEKNGHDVAVDRVLKKGLGPTWNGKKP